MWAICMQNKIIAANLILFVTSLAIETIFLNLVKVLGKCKKPLVSVAILRKKIDNTLFGFFKDWRCPCFLPCGVGLSLLLA